MVLTKTDLKQITEVVKGVVAKEINGSEKRIIKKTEEIVYEIVNTEVREVVDTEVREIISAEVSSLAAMTSRGFQNMQVSLDEINKKLALHDFKLTEVVNKAEYFMLEERVKRIEKRVGIKNKI